MIRIKHLLASVVIADPSSCALAKLTYLRAVSGCPEQFNLHKECTMAGTSSNVRLSSTDLRRGKMLCLSES